MNKREEVVKELIDKIRKVKIQGAESISIESVKTLKKVIKFSDKKTSRSLLIEIMDFSKRVRNIRPTEPCLNNSLDYIINKSMREVSKNDFIAFIKNVINSCDEVIDHFSESKKIMNNIIFKKIPNNSIVFTHCHSTSVVDALIEAHKRGKRFTVHNTETRPLFQGRITARELSNAGIKVVHFVDSAARLALKKSDIMLIGADAITSEGKIINKIGSELFAEVAHKYDIPVYSCTNSWKFDPGSVFAFELKIEKRFGKEVWQNKPKNVVINNFAFEIINPTNITGVISELGIFRPTIFTEEFRHSYPELFWKKKLNI